MLPDFLKVKEKLQKMLDYQMRRAHLSHMGPLANIPVSMVFEGSKTVLIREDGSVEEQSSEIAIADIEVKSTEVEEMRPEMVLDKVDNAAQKIAEQQARTFYRQLDKSAEEGGNVVSSGGEPFSIDLQDLHFELLEKIDMDFDEAGNPQGVAFVVNPKVMPSIADALSQALADPDNERRHKEIIERKREEWRVRVSSRKLVG